MTQVWAALNRTLGYIKRQENLTELDKTRELHDYGTVESEAEMLTVRNAEADPRDSNGSISEMHH